MKKKVVLLSSLIALTNFITPTNCAEISVPQTQETYKVLRVIDGDTMYIDFNRDGYYQKDEKVRVNGIDTFEVKPSYWLDNQMKRFNFTQTEALGLGYYGKEFAKKNLLNKEVIVKFSTNPATEKETSDLIKNDTEGVSPTPKGQEIGTKTHDVFNRDLVSIYFTDGRSYEQEVLKQGLATVYEKSNLAEQLKEYENLDKVYKNSEKARKLDLVLLNKKNGKYHKPTCKYGQMASNAELVEKPVFSLKYKFATCCLENASIPEYAKKANNLSSNNKKYNSKALNRPLFAKTEKDEPDIKTDNIEFYFIDGYKYAKPVSYCRTSAVQALIREINKAESTIDFAVFGFSSQPELLSAILEAKSRGVKVRWITDMTPWNFNFYSGTKETLKIIPDYKTDYLTDKMLLEKYQKRGKTTYNGTLIHDKYFVIDEKVVWTGSTNVSSSGTGGYNTNLSTVIYSKEIAQLFEEDFNKMYEQNLFHKAKQPLDKQNIKLADGSIVDVYFSPNKNIATNGVLPIIKNATNYIYVPIFYLTDKNIFNELENAKNRGVDVKVIVDAHYANTMHSKIDEIRKLGLKVKAENWGGKMHMKSLVADDNYVIVGSCNFTNSGMNNNDENMLIIQNPILAKEFKKKFEEYWNVIPEKWLLATPNAEGPDSIGSCTDGLDNDHNGFTDDEDFSCKAK
ncbi:MAG: phospholipase D-like domain-containing protein [Candidatus Gastranaerophilales bacterium]